MRVALSRIEIALVVCLKSASTAVFIAVFIAVSRLFRRWNYSAIIQLPSNAQHWSTAKSLAGAAAVGRRNPAGDVSILSSRSLLEKERNRYYLVLVSTRQVIAEGRRIPLFLTPLSMMVCCCLIFINIIIKYSYSYSSPCSLCHMPL